MGTSIHLLLIGYSPHPCTPSHLDLPAFPLHAHLDTCNPQIPANATKNWQCVNGLHTCAFTLEWPVRIDNVAMFGVIPCRPCRPCPLGSGRGRRCSNHGSEKHLRPNLVQSGEARRDAFRFHLGPRLPMEHDVPDANSSPHLALTVTAATTPLPPPLTSPTIHHLCWTNHGEPNPLRSPLRCCRDALGINGPFPCIGSLSMMKPKKSKKTPCS